MDFSISPYAPGREMPLFGTPDLMAEEERKRRELQAKMDQQARLMAMSDEAVASGGFAPVEPTPIKETRTIDPVTGEVKLKIEGSERDLSAANPNTPTVSSARAPDDTFNRMIQAESGGRQTDAQGRVLTSNKGAMGIAQVMPATAMQPGYGVPTIFDLAQKRGIPFQNRDLASAQQLLANKDLNQEFGQNYYNAMNKRFDGGPGAVAAYNAGPGRVAQNMAQNQGQLNVGQLPQETQGYLQKVGMPPRPVSPQQVAQPPAQAPQQMPANQGIKIPGLMPTNQMSQQPVATQPAQSPLQMGIERFQANQDNLDELVKMRNDQSIPEYLRKRSADRAYELMNSQYKQSQAQSKLDSMVQSGDQMGIAKALSSKPRDEEGSWLKMLALGFISPELAGAEAVKLGLAPTKWSQATYTDKEGNQVAVEIKKRSDGKILAGSKMDGTPLTAEELNLATNSLGSKLNLVGGTYVNDKTGEVGRVISDEKTGRTYVQTDKGPRPLDGFRPQSSTGTAADQRARLIQEMNIKLQGKAGEEAMAIQRKYNELLVGQGLAPMQPGETPISAPQIASGQPAVAGARPVAPAAPAVAGTAAPAAPAGPISPAASAAAGPRPTATEIAATGEAQKKASQEVGEDLGKIKVNQPKAESNADYLLTKINELVTHPGFEVSVGATVQPLFQIIPGTDKASWYKRFDEVKGQSFLQAIENLRGMGALSNLEGEAATKAIQRMDTSQSEKEFKAAAKDFQDIITRGIDRNRVKLGQKPKYGTPEASEQTKPASTNTNKVRKYNPQTGQLE